MPSCQAGPAWDDRRAGCGRVWGAPGRPRRRRPPARNPGRPRGPAPRTGTGTGTGTGTRTGTGRPAVASIRGPGGDPARGGLARVRRSTASGICSPNLEPGPVKVVRRCNAGAGVGRHQVCGGRGPPGVLTEIGNDLCREVLQAGDEVIDGVPPHSDRDQVHACGLLLFDGRDHLIVAQD
jgi:hypothetical protein